MLGGSKGAEAGLVLASKYPQIKAVVAFSPCCVVWQGIPLKRFEIGKDVKSSWSYKGEKLPYLAYPTDIKKRDLLLLRLRRMHEDALENTIGVTNEAIQVDNIQGATLVISGERDQMWPATKMSKIIMNRLEANKFEYHYEHIAYDAGHNRIVISKDCWRKIFRFLEDNY